MATQLRRYTIAEGQMDRFVAWFPNIIPAREAYGFTVDWAYADREHNQFVWSVSTPATSTPPSTPTTSRPSARPPSRASRAR